MNVADVSRIVRAPLVLLVCALLVLSACGGTAPAATGSDTPSNAQATDDAAPITVWIDSTRESAIKLYKDKHPDTASKIKVELVDRGQFPAKVLLFNNSGSGWPDVVFAEPELVGQVADATHNFPADLSSYVTKDVLDKFAANANAPCMFDGKLFCLRNDLAQVVLWYNKKLMDQFGYTVPKTWEEYEALGAQVAKDHPGYIVGAFGDEQGLNTYFWGSRCPVSQLQSGDTTKINMSDPKCTRAADMVDRMIANGSMSKLSPFDPAFAKIATDNKLLMLPAASWYGEYVFGGKPDSTYYKTAEGQLDVAMPLKWQDDDKIYTGAHGGSAWSMSRHTKNPKLAADLILWLTTSNDYQGIAPTYPAYTPAADVWRKTLQGNKVYAEDPFPVLKDAAGLIDGSWSNVRYDKSVTFKTVVIGAVQKGQTVASALAEYQKQLSSLAQTQGYKVVNQ